MKTTSPPKLSAANHAPSHVELVSEIFAEATRQKVTLIDLSAITTISLSKLKRIKAHQYPPALPEYLELCKALGRTPAQIDEAARFHRNISKSA